MTNVLALDAVGSRARRTVLDELRNGERSVRQLTDALPVSQSAVSQHLAVLRRAELVRVRTQGTRRLYSVDLEGLGEIRAWVDQFWDGVLTSFVEHAESPGPEAS